MACVPPDRTGTASGISTTTRFTAIVMSVGMLGAVFATRTHAAFVAGTQMTPDVKAALDAGFMSHVLAGDMVQATAHLPPALQAMLVSAAHASFASGFAAALYLASAVGVSIIAGIGLLNRKGKAVRVRGVASNG